MKKFTSIVFLIFFVVISNAQNIAINETGAEPDTSAMLDISSTSKGLLIPRMTKAQRNAIPSPGTGLLVFQTAPDSVGFHYFDGSDWRWLAANTNGQAWQVTGNAATDSAIHFLGTTDDKPVMLRQNNLPMGQLNSRTHNFFIGGGAGVNTTAAQNTGFGDSALFNNTSGLGNTAVGYRAMVGKTPITGSNNIAVGSNSLTAVTSGIQNVMMGYKSAINLTSGNYNVALGSGTMYEMIKGDGNIAIGSSALRNNDSSSYNIAIGHEALYNNDSARNIGIGYQALFYNNRRSNLAIGHQAGTFNSFLQTATHLGVENTYLGFQSGYYANTGSQNVAVGSRALMGTGYFNGDDPNNLFYKRNVAIGDSAMFASYGSDNVAIGYRTLSKSNNSGAHVAVGSRALVNTTATYPNTAVGYSSQDSNTVGVANTSLGSYTLQKNTQGYNNTAIGNFAMGDAFNAATPSYVNDNTAVGNDALRLARYYGETAIGAGALRNDTGGRYNTAVGFLAMHNHKLGNLNTAVGVSALRNDINGFQNTAVGVDAMHDHKSGNMNTALGGYALYKDTTGFANVAVGANAMYNHLTNNYNTAVGFETMYFDNNGFANTAMGYRSLRYAKNGVENTAIGVGAIEFTDSSLYNVAVGRGAMMGKGGRHNTALGFYSSGVTSGVPTTDLYVNETTTVGAYAGYKNIGNMNTFVGVSAGYGASADSLRGIENTGVGAYTLYYNTSGKSNTTLGIGTMFSNTTGNGNVAVGTRALGYSNGNYNVAIGDSAMFNNNADGNLAAGTFAMRNNNTGAYNTATGNYALLNNTNGHRNVALGDSALSANTTGSTNTGIGYLANTSSANLNNATAIGANAFVAQNNSVVLGSINGVNGADADTKVGIGTTTPDSTLSVANKFTVGKSGTIQFDNSVPVMNYMFKSGDTNPNRMVFAHSTGFPGWGLQYIDAGDKFNFMKPGADVLTVDLDRMRTGVNTVNPDSTFSVANKFSVGSSGTVQYDNSVSIMNYMFKSGNNNANRMLFAHSQGFPNWGLQYQDAGDKFNFVASGVNAVTVDLTNLRMGIGVTNPTYQLHLSTDQAAKLTTSTWTTTSDIRLKTIDGNYTKGLKDVMKLNTIMYHYAKGNARNLATDVQAYGFSAQEVQKVFPEAVTEEKDGYLSLNIHPILVAYVNAFKEQQQQIETLQKEVATEKANTADTLEKMMKRIEMLETKLAATK
jgi:hypothetical protein